MAGKSDQNKKSPVASKKRSYKLNAKNLANHIKQRVTMPGLYVVACLVILVFTVTVWSFLDAKIQQSNADQLVNSYLFENFNTFTHASLPGAHSFLIKWPLFLLIRLFGSSSGAFIAITVLSVFATVGLLVYVLNKIERRPVVFGTLCLALASVLLMVPVQPYPGALLPVNMAMIATRNLEYALYIVSILIFLKSGSYRKKWHWLAVVILAILIASDKLFVGISILTGLCTLIIYSLKRRQADVTLGSRWLGVSILASGAAIGLLAVLNLMHFGHIVAGSGSSPYTLISNGKNFVIALIYVLMGILTNFGANPAYSTVLVKNVPHQFISGLFTIGGLAYLINLVVLVFCIYAVFHLIKTSLTHKASEKLVFDRYFSLGILLVFSTLAAIVMFVASNHYYAVDARYLTIALFSFFVSAAILTRHYDWPKNYLLLWTGILCISIIFGLASKIQAYSTFSDALQSTNERNALVAEALKNNPNHVLVGDYWRVVPIRDKSKNRVKILPLASCTVPRNVLTSSTWQPDLKTQSFAYLLSLDKGLTDYPKCTYDDILTKYGAPDSSILIAGSLTKPKELLLIYGHGANKPVPAIDSTPKGAILPIDLVDLSNTGCEGKTIMNVVAHEDDDLLFMNPDILHDIQNGTCIRTVYLTSGDSGADRYYWLSRQRGSEAAYSKMYNSSADWSETIVKISPKQFITIASPKDNNKISLIFVHLPDGGLKGGGFTSTNNETIERLGSTNEKIIHTTDKQSSYNMAGIVHMLSSLMYVYQPSEVRTQSSFQTASAVDHHDHMAAGRLTKKAFSAYNVDDQSPALLKFYIGYPIREKPQNVFGDDFNAKEQAFLEYAKYDPAVCHSIEQCSPSSTYGSFLLRQYQADH